MDERYARNVRTLSEQEVESLKDIRVCVVGCGGLGGYIIEMLGRLGVGHITAIDGDVFEVTNLNRQILSDETVLGKSKALTAGERMKKVNSTIEVVPVQAFITEDNCDEMLSGHNLVMDALDNIESRRIIEKCCEKHNIPLIHGAISGWYAQISVVMPGDRTFDRIYPESASAAAYSLDGNPPFTPALAASIQVAEAVKLLFNKGTSLKGKMLFINLLEQSYDIFEL